MDPTVSIILSSFNQPNTLRLALESLDRQIERDFEVVIADDGSDGDTLELVEEFSGRVPFDVAFETEPHDGFRKARALNRGVRRSRGEYLLFLDGDCLAPAVWIARHLEALRRGADYSVAGYVYLSLEASRRITVERVREGSFETLITPAQRRWFGRRHLLQRYYQLVRKTTKPRILGGNWAVRRAALEAINGFDEMYDGFSKEDSDARNRLNTGGFRPASLWHRNWVFHLDHDLDPRRTRPDVIRRRADKAYYNSRKKTVRCAHGLVDERDAAETGGLPASPP